MQWYPLRASLCLPSAALVGLCNGPIMMHVLDKNLCLRLMCSSCSKHMNQASYFANGTHTMMPMLAVLTYAGLHAVCLYHACCVFQEH
jgi:hypothetical protein